jgi:hypothetical protein
MSLKPISFLIALSLWILPGCGTGVEPGAVARPSPVTTGVADASRTPAKPGRDGSARLETLALSLARDDSQSARFRSMFTEARGRTIELRGDRTALTAYIKGWQARFEALLTPEQRARFESIRRQRWDLLPAEYRVVVRLADAVGLSGSQKAALYSCCETCARTVWFFRFVLTGASLPAAA